jgi:hypothetical protein
MMVKASGRSALILATGLFVCFAGPSLAATGADTAAATAKPEKAGAPVTLHKYARRGTHHGQKYAHRKSSKVAQRPDADKTADAADDGDHSSALPPAVANANAAQLASTDTPTGNAAKAMSARASDILQAAPAQPAADGQVEGQVDGQVDGKVVAADQLNDVDRALREAPPPSTPAAATLTVAAAEAPAPPAAAVAATGSDNSTWDQTSLIGKIFIGFGALLTMASAARMFMA